MPNDLARGWLGEAEQQVDECGLAGAAWPDKCGVLACVDLYINVIESRGRFVWVGKRDIG